VSIAEANPANGPGFPMRSRIGRHLAAMLDPAAAGRPRTPPPELSGRDYAIFLLRLAAEVEHGLMVQYLFAAYSLGGPQVPADQRANVRAWQETILGIAKEEMGHLITVQNLLRSISAPLNFNRDEFPHDTSLYPFGFRLRPVTLESLASYICAESPADWKIDAGEEQAIKADAQIGAGSQVNRVGVLYEELERVLKDPAQLAEADFSSTSVRFQASWDEWGRGYREEGRGREAMDSLPQLPAPELIILSVDSRARALQAIAEVGEQGEGLAPADENESHFQRFLVIYRALKGLGPQAGDVVRPLAANPTTDLGGPDVGPAADVDSTTPIVFEEAKLWAHLFNVRYRKLLVNLSHAFELSESPGERPIGPRGTLIHRTFAEMYHLRSIAGRLVALPVDGADPDGPRAGPPFQIPYTLMLPSDEAGRWRMHRDLLDASRAMIGRLTQLPAATPDRYLTALAELDAAERAQVERLIPGGPNP
jgi:ferritin-like protein